MQIKFELKPCQQSHLYRSAAKMTSVSETTRTLRYKLRSREIYIEEPITSLEILSEHPQRQEESISSIQETPNSQFRLVLSVTPCVPRISSLESVNDCKCAPSDTFYSFCEVIWSTLDTFSFPFEDCIGHLVCHMEPTTLLNR